MSRRLGVALVLAVLAGVPAAAQVNRPRYGVGTLTATQSRADLNTVNPYLGPATNLHLEFPIFNRSTGGAPELQAVLVYDSQFWGDVSGTWQPQAGNGWWLRTAANAQVIETDSDNTCGWTDGSGGDDGSGDIETHAFSLREPDGTMAAAGSYISVDGPYGTHTEAEYSDCPSPDSLPRTWAITDATAGTTNWPPSACGQTYAVSGYLTTYSRSPLGQIVSVSQDAQPGNGGTEARSFAFDQLGRMTSEWNPETRGVYYSFDSDAACGTSANDLGNLVKRTDNAGNITCYHHDAEGRVVLVHYASGPNAPSTPDKNFVYDAATLGGVGMQRVVGRLAEAYTGTAASKIVDEGAVEAVTIAAPILSTSVRRGRQVRRSMPVLVFLWLTQLQGQRC